MGYKYRINSKYRYKNNRGIKIYSNFYKKHFTVLYRQTYSNIDHFPIEKYSKREFLHIHDTKGIKICKTPKKVSKVTSRSYFVIKEVMNLSYSTDYNKKYNRFVTSMIMLQEANIRRIGRLNNIYWLDIYINLPADVIKRIYDTSDLLLHQWFPCSNIRKIDRRKVLNIEIYENNISSITKILFSILSIGARTKKERRWIYNFTKRVRQELLYTLKNMQSPTPF